MIGLDLLTGGSNRTAIAVLGGILAAVLLAVVVGWRCYGAGYDKAEAKGRAEIAELRQAFSDASANASEESRQETVKLARRGNDLAAQLTNARRELAAARAEASRRIADVALSVPDSCVFGGEFVRWWNETAGLCTDAAAGADHPGGAPGRTGEARPACPELRPGESVSRQALMANFRDLAAYCRETEAVSAKRLQLLEEWAR